MRESDKRWLRDKDLTTEQRRERNVLATERAKKILKPGDRLCVSRCGGSQPTVTFVEWEGMWIRSVSLDDIAAVNILRINRQLVGFYSRKSVGRKMTPEDAIAVARRTLYETGVIELHEMSMRPKHNVEYTQEEADYALEIATAYNTLAQTVPATITDIDYWEQDALLKIGDEVLYFQWSTTDEQGHIMPPTIKDAVDNIKSDIEHGLKYPRV